MADQPTRRAPAAVQDQHGIVCSMSRRGNCYDNAVMESWCSAVKSEEGERFESYADAKEALFDATGRGAPSPSDPAQAAAAALEAGASAGW